MTKLLGKFGIIILLLAAVLSGGYLMFEKEIQDYLGATVIEESSDEALKIAYIFGPSDLNPMTSDQTVRSRLHDVYEGLVSADSSLRIVPALAVSWGVLDDQTWEFILRPDVQFHDGQPLTVQDVLYSFDLARDSEIADLLANVEAIVISGENVIQIQTSSPDPLLLAKLSHVPVVKENFEDFKNPIGTGKYQVIDADLPDKISYQAFENHWSSDLSSFKIVEISTIRDKQSRINALKDGEIDFLANVPPDAVEDLEFEKVRITSIPTLEVGFIMFNFFDQNFKEKLLREAIAKAIDRNVFLELAQGFATTQSQFVSSGVFGYNPDILIPERDSENAQKQVQLLSSQFQNLQTEFYFPQELGLLGDFIKEELAKISIDVTLRPVSATDYQSLLVRGDMPFYYLGWRSELGDALPFLQNVVASQGEYNGSNYANLDLDRQIAAAGQNMNVKTRLKAMQDAMKTLVEDEIIGVPLFETSFIYAYDQELEFTPRVDGAVYPSAFSMLK